MKRAFVVALLSMLLASALGGTLLVKPGTANPLAWSTTVTLLSPENKTYVQNSIQIEFTYTEQMVCNPYYQCTLDGKRSAWLLADFDGSVNHANITGLSDGNHTLNIHLTAEGRTFSGWVEGYSSTAVFVVDTTPPSIEILSPRPLAYESDVPLNFTVTESTSLISYSLDRKENVAVSGNTTLADLPSGAHNVTVYAWDTAGNVVASETITFTIDEPEPFPTIWIATAAVSAVVFIAGLIFYLRKRKH